jgi:ferrochelatase
MALRDAVERELGPDIPVVLAMRYGRPSIAAGLAELRRRGVDRVVVFPLYPQLASSSTGTYWNVPDLVTVPPFYDHPGFLDAWAAVGGPMLAAAEPKHVIFSFHGLPERQIRKADDSGRHCLASESCCDRIEPVNRNCYRAQCFATARLLADRLSLSADRTTVTFQSRLGRTPWIRPFTDLELAELPRRGVKRVAIFSPAFVADCLETLEELGIRGRATFLSAGGAEFTFVPSLNTHPLWVNAVVGMIRKALG